ncbi:helix-turn-helix domain-containing protein [Photobacterium leiognathi]|uniref:helix-turn-helix domain-containing protein n=1 Tax=Photobacterium leiognathi TaxID=553611 RepID=UPI0034E5D87A
MSFRQAAEITGVPNSTLSRRISAFRKSHWAAFAPPYNTKKLSSPEKMLVSCITSVVVLYDMKKPKLAHQQLSDIAESLVVQFVCLPLLIFRLTSLRHYYPSLQSNTQKLNWNLIYLHDVWI